MFKCGRVLQGPVSSVRSFICGIPRKALQCWTTRELGALSRNHDSTRYLGWRADFLGIHPALCRCLETKSFLGCTGMTPVQLEARPWATLKGATCPGDVGEAPLWARFARSLWAGQEHLQPEPQEGAVACAWPTPLSMRPFGGLHRTQLSAVLGRWVIEAWVWKSASEANPLPRREPSFLGWATAALDLRKRAVPQCCPGIRDWGWGSRVWKLARGRSTGKIEWQQRELSRQLKWFGGEAWGSVGKRQQQKGTLGRREFNLEERSLGGQHIGRGYGNWEIKPVLLLGIGPEQIGKTKFSVTCSHHGLIKFY